MCLWLIWWDLIWIKKIFFKSKDALQQPVIIRQKSQEKKEQTHKSLPWSRACLFSLKLFGHPACFSLCLWWCPIMLNSSHKCFNLFLTHLKDNLDPCHSLLWLENLCSEELPCYSYKNPLTGFKFKLQYTVYIYTVWWIRTIN